MIKKLLSTILPKNPAQERAEIYRHILQIEAKIGGQLFGPVLAGGRREFFCLDEHTWVWHEEWTDANKVRHTLTTRYDVRPHGIFKAQDGQPYQPVSKEEAERLLQTARKYNHAVYAHFVPQMAA